MNLALSFFVALVVVIITSAKGVSGRQQYFRVRPEDVEVAEGGTAVIPCEVGNREGRVQWTKDGLTLGYDRSIPGIPRYEVLGSDNSGQFSLRITDVHIDDDADYECQVGPASYNKPIRHAAHLHVLLPPKSISITGYANGQRIDIREHEELELTCTVENSKPKAGIVWYKNNNVFQLDSTEETEEDGSMSGRKTVTSKIKFRPTARDNRARITCQATHPALVGASASDFRTSVYLSVHYPPGPPVIQGYEGEVVELGDPVDLICVSHGGNPLAEVHWYKNDQLVDFEYTTSGGLESRNVHSFIADTDDNLAKFRCEAKNHLSPEPMTTEVVMQVHFAPDKVTITGPTEAKAGDELEFKCETGNSNPAASIQWLVDGVQVHENFTVSATSPNGGWTTKSSLKVKIGPGDRTKIIHCYAINAQLGKTSKEMHTVSVLYPPGTPNITGLAAGAVLHEGQQVQLTCISLAGNPLAELTWFKGTEKIEGTSTEKTGSDYSKSVLTIVANRSDNSVPYRCEASNSATPNPLITETTLNVLFKPNRVTVTSDPEKPSAGKRATLKCETGSSKPIANITWHFNGIQMSGDSTSIRSGENGGTITVSLLEVVVTPEHDGGRFICEARNPELAQSVHNSISLSVKYKPRFDDDVDGSVFTVEEGKSIVINLTATANPPEIDYKWTSPERATIPSINPDDESQVLLDDPRFVAQGGVLNVTDAKRADHGVYKVRAKNNEGKEVIKFTLDVHYKPKITEITEYVMVSPGESAEFACAVDANPLTASSIEWRRVGPDMKSGNETSFSNVTRASYLHIRDVKPEDSGAFECVVNNGIGEKVKNVTYLLVRQKPTIDTSPKFAKAASDKGKSGTLVCRAKGAPEIEFAWSRKGSVINVEKDKSGEKYEMETEMIDMLTWESKLLVKNVSSKDFGNYDCIARNAEGLDRFTVNLNVTSRPDPPSLLRVVNLTYESVTLKWLPGFDGGFPQSFRIRYRRGDDKVFQYTDVPPGVDTFEVEDLRYGTKYSFAIMAYNAMGESEYSSDIEEVETRSPVPVTDYDMEGDRVAIWSRGFILAVALLAAALLLVNGVVVFCYIKRRRKTQVQKRQQKGGGSSSDSTKSATIEMYVNGSSYNGNDTISATGETLSSLSDKSGTSFSSSMIDGKDHRAFGHHLPHHIHPGSMRLPVPHEVEEDLDDFDEPGTNRAAACTYLTDDFDGLPAPHQQYLHNHDHPYSDFRFPRNGSSVPPNYVTIPRNTFTPQYQSDQHSIDRRRQALDVPLASNHDIYVPSETATSLSFPPPPPSTDGGLSYYPESGLYVPPASIGLPPPPRPPRPQQQQQMLYNEYEGHLV